MAKIDYNIFEIEPIGLTGFRSLSTEDVSLMSSAQISKTFKPNDNFIELSFYALDNVRLQTVSSYTNYSILSGDTKQGQEGTSEIGIDVIQDYISYGFQGQEVKALYNFLDYPYSNTLNPQDFYIESISPDRTEVRLLSVNLGGSEVLDTTNQLINSFNNEPYTPDLYLYFGNNIFFSIVNIDVEEFRDTNAVLLKLYNPLPSSVNVKSRLNIVEKVSNSIAFEINTVITPDTPIIPTLRGANFNVDVEEQSTEPSQYYNYTELFSFPTNNTYRELNSLFNEKGAELGIDYSEFSNFLNFSSAEERLRNFKYKLDLINSYQSSLDNIDATGIAYTNTGITGSKVYYENLLNGVVNNFDHYERHLYFESGSTSWPKSNNSKPYINQESSDTEATNWYLSEIEDAILFDAQNPDILTNTVPAYLKEDPDNRPYELFIHMIAQHFDNLWIYTDAVSKKYDNDNRLNRGVSKDLVEDLLKNFGIKLYTSNKSVEDLFKYFTVNSYDSGGEVLGPNIGGGIIKAPGQQPVSQNDYQKEIYKRIYHNLPLLMKSKGTERGLRALINCFGIPSDILKIRIFGGQSANDLPFFGGEQAWTGSLDKVRLDNTGSIVTGNTLSFYTSIINPNKEYTQDLHRIEVGFSPTHNIDDYIVSQSIQLFPNDPFNIDDYIGDPRGYPTNRYTELYRYAEIIFENVDAYNVKDFVRLIKFFDNVIFRMVRDFIPARSVTDAGIIIKPHLLDRNKAKEPTLTWTRPEYTGSIDTAFIQGSNAGAYTNTGFGAFRGESRANYLRRVRNTVSGSTLRRVNDFFDPEVEQVEKNFGEAKFDGELANSRIRVSNGELNIDNPYKQIDYPEIKYNVRFYKEIPSSICILSEPEGDYIINIGETVNLPQSNIFLGDLPAPTYTFKVDDAEPNVDANTHTFTSFQYGFAEVRATHNQHPNITNLNTGQTGCSEARVIRCVNCRLSAARGNYPSIATVSTSYNLFEWFFGSDVDFVEDPQQDGIINYDITYFVNDVEVGKTLNGEQYTPNSTYTIQTDPTNYTFSNLSPGTDNVRVVAQDTYDSNCKIELFLPFDLCTLFDTFVERPELDLFLTDGVDPGAPNPGNLYYTYPFGFGGVTDATGYEFQIRVIHQYQNQPSEYGPTDWISIPDPEGGSAGQGSISGVPSNYTTLISAFPSAEPNDVPEVNTTNYSEEYFKRQIRFRATSGDDCQLESRWYLMKRAAEELRAIDLIRSTIISNASDGVYFCGLPEADNTVTVYIYVAQTAGTVQPSTVINQRLRIYKEDGVTPADRGIYGYTADNGYMQGRRWLGADDGYSSGHWDTNWNYSNQNQGYSVTNGLYICGPINGGGGDDNNNIGLQ
jgi:hypothetical protein